MEKADELRLIQEYEPILLFSTDRNGNPENYFPMAAEHFVQQSGLRQSGSASRESRWLLQPGEVTLEDLVRYGGESSENLYLAYAAGDVPEAERLLPALETKGRYTSDIEGGLTPDETRTVLGTSGLDMPPEVIEKAREKYKEAYGPAHWVPYPPVYHYAVCDYDDEQYRYIALSYWFLYAFNDWGSHEGINFHEGDWEMVCVILDAEEHPQWVGYSAHFRGNTRSWVQRRRADPFLQDVSTVTAARAADGPARVGNHPVVYVACGSHACYPEQQTFFDKAFERAAGDGLAVGPAKLEMDQPWGAPIRLDEEWNRAFRGKWGAPLGAWDGVPVSPAHPKREEQWRHPAKWAGKKALRHFRER